MSSKIVSHIQRPVVTIDEERTVLEAAVLMTKEYIASLVITSSSIIKGIFTESDIMMKVVGEKMKPAEVKIKSVMKLKSVMKCEPSRVTPDYTAKQCLELMKKNRCRHLLVYNGDEFMGIVSLRDMVALLIEEKEGLIEQLKQYITS